MQLKCHSFNIVRVVTIISIVLLSIDLVQVIALNTQDNAEMALIEMEPVSPTSLVSFVRYQCITVSVESEYIVSLKSFFNTPRLMCGACVCVVGGGLCVCCYM